MSEISIPTNRSTVLAAAKTDYEENWKKFHDHQTGKIHLSDAELKNVIAKWQFAWRIMNGRNHSICTN